MAPRAHGPSQPEGFFIRLQRRDDAAKIVCATLLLGIAILALRIASIWWVGSSARSVRGTAVSLAAAASLKACWPTFQLNPALVLFCERSPHQVFDERE